MAADYSKPLFQSDNITTDTSHQGFTSRYFALPSMLRSRLPTITTIRQSASDATSRPIVSSRTTSIGQTTPAPTPITASRSRRESVYSIDVTRSAASSTLPSPRFVGSDPNDRELAFQTSLDLDIPNQRLSAGGVDWLLASAGVRLWLNAQRQADLPGRNPALLRSMHIDALKYMGMALPSDLSASEIETLQGSLPPQLLHSTDRHGRELVSTKPNILRQSVAQAVCWMIALTMLVIPLLMTAVNRIFVYERKHRVAQRILVRGADITKALGEQGLVVGNAVVEFGDTPLGKAGLNLTTWFIEGVVAGVSDGYAMSTKNVQYLE